MSEARRLRLGPLWWTGGVFLVLLVIYGSLTPSSALPRLWASDKLQHFAAYCSVAFWFAGMTERRRYPLVAGALLLLGAAMEIGQALMGFGRAADWRDFAANTLGIAAALAAAYAGLGSWMLQVERRLGLS